jgi:hypothetical protein
MAEPVPRHWTHHWPAVVVTLLLCLRTISTWGTESVNPFEGSVYLTGAQRLLDGQTIYRDFHSIYAPGIYYLPMLGLKLTSEPHLALQVIAMPIHLANILLVAWISTKLIANRWACVLAVIGAATYGSAGSRLLFVLLGLVALIEFTRSRRSIWPAIAGVMASVNLAVFQDMAAYAGVGLFVGAVACGWVLGAPERRTRCALRAGALVCVGFLIGTAVWMGLMALNGTAWLYIESAFIHPLRYYDTLSMDKVPPPWAPPPLMSGVVSFWARFGLDGVFRWFFYTLPFYWVPGAAILTLAIGSFRIARPTAGSITNARHWAVLIGVAALGLCMSRTIWRTGDELKLAANSLPGIFLLAFFASSLLARPSRWLNVAGAALAASLLVFLSYREVQSAYKSRNDAPPSLELLRIGNDDLIKITHYLREHQKTGTLYVVPNAPVLYLSTGLKNATRADYLDPIIEPVVGPRVLEELKQSRPEHVVIGLKMKFWKKYEFGHQFGVPIDAYIRQQYTPVFRSGSYEVFARNDVEPTTQPGTAEPR